MTFAVMLAVPAVALASTVDVTSVVDVTAPTGAVTLQPGQSENITINMRVTGAQAQSATFEVNQDWVLQSDGTFVGSNPKEFTVPGGRTGSTPALLLSTTGTVSVANDVAASTTPRTLTVGVFDITNATGSGGKLAAGTSATYAVTVTDPPDTTAPQVTAIARTTTSPTNTTGNLSWNVTFSESVTGVDIGDFNLIASSGLTGAAFPTTGALSGSGANYTVTASSGSGDGTLGLNLTDNDSIKDGANNVLVGASSANGGFTGEVYTIDRTAPTVTPTALKGVDPNYTGGAYSEGDWTNKDVQVTFKCEDNDGGSGLSDASASSGDDVQTFTANTSASGTTANFGATCADAAGNAATSDLSFGPIKIDKDAPVITDDSANNPPTGTAGPNNNGWYISAVTNTFKASDGLSGFLSPLTDPYTFTKGSGTAEGDAVKINSGSVSDKASNAATAVDSAAFKIDMTKPTISVALTPAAAATGWYNLATGAPTADYTCNDADGDGSSANGGASGVATCGPDHTFGSDADPQTNTGTAKDNAGLSDTASVNGVKVDLSKPTNVAFQGGPAADSSHDFGSVPAAPTGCTANDTFSGFDSCAVTGYSTAVGNHTLTATAKDKAGNQETATRSYSVKAANASGYYQPVDMGGVLNTVKSGSTVPVKFELFGGFTNTEQKTTGAVSSMTASKVNCAQFTGDPVDQIEYLAPTSENTGLRFDTTGDQFIYNWKTPAKAANTCYSVTMTAADNTTKLVAYFQLK